MNVASVRSTTTPLRARVDRLADLVAQLGRGVQVGLPAHDDHRGRAGHGCRNCELVIGVAATSSDDTPDRLLRNITLRDPAARAPFVVPRLRLVEEEMWPRCGEHSDRGVGEHGRGHVRHVTVGQEDDTGQHGRTSCRRRGRRRSGPGGELRSAHAPPAVWIRRGSSSDRPLELRLVHLRATLDPLAARLFVQLRPWSASATAPVRAETTPATGRDVRPRQPRRGPRLAVTSAFLVDGASGDLLGDVLRLATFLEPVLDVLVLASPLRLPSRPLWAAFVPPRVVERCRYPRGCLPNQDRRSPGGGPGPARPSRRPVRRRRAARARARAARGCRRGRRTPRALRPPSRTGRRRTARAVRRCPRTSPRRGRRSAGRWPAPRRAGL